MRKALRRLALASLAALLLAGCGDRPPRDYRPIRGSCDSLLGQWMVTRDDLRWIAPELRLPDGVAYPFLAIERDRNGLVELVLRRRSTDVLAEAATLRMVDPDAYAVWRARALGLPIDPELASMPASAAGPLLDRRWQLGLDRCDGGWRTGSAGHVVAPREGSEDAEHLAFVGLARGEGGTLLVQHHVRRENITDFVFFGQSVRWFGYAYSDWHRIAPAPAGAMPPPLAAADLPEVPSRSLRMALEYQRGAEWSRFEAALRRQLPPDVTVTLLRRRQFDPAVMALPPDQLRAELAGHWPAGQPDPFLPLLQSQPRVSEIEVKQARLGPRNRPYRLVEFTLTVGAAERNGG